MRDQQKEMIDWMERVLKQEERYHILKGTAADSTGAIESLKEYAMNHETNSNNPDEQVDINRLPEFWRQLVLEKDAFPDEKDYYASIRVLELMQECISEILAPYFKASLIATKRPGEMQALEREIHAGVFDGLGSDKGKGSLLERALGSPSPENYVDFPGIAAQIRAWREHRPIIRCLLLLGLVDRLNGHLSFKNCLESPSALLCGQSPATLMEQGKWEIVADYIDDLMIGD